MTSNPLRLIRATSIATEGPWAVKLIVNSLDEAMQLQAHMATLVSSPHAADRMDAAALAAVKATDGWTDANLAIAQQIKDAIDRAREHEVTCLYPVNVWVKTEAFLWPWPEWEWPIKGQFQRRGDIEKSPPRESA